MSAQDKDVKRAIRSLIDRTGALVVTRDVDQVVAELADTDPDKSLKNALRGNFEGDLRFIYGPDLGQPMIVGKVRNTSRRRYKILQVRDVGEDAPDCVVAPLGENSSESAAIQMAGSKL